MQVWTFGQLCAVFMIKLITWNASFDWETRQCASVAFSNQSLTSLPFMQWQNTMWITENNSSFHVILRCFSVKINKSKKMHNRSYGYDAVLISWRISLTRIITCWLWKSVTSVGLILKKVTDTIAEMLEIVTVCWSVTSTIPIEKENQLSYKNQ